MTDFIRTEDIITAEEIKKLESEYVRVSSMMVAKKVINNTFNLLLEKLEDPEFGVFPQDKLARLIKILESGV